MRKDCLGYALRVNVTGSPAGVKFKLSKAREVSEPRDLLPVIRSALAMHVAGHSGEVDSVWAMFSKGLPELRKKLKPIYGDALNVNAVFCHGHPRAHFRSKASGQTSCEAGDLLLVVHQRDGQRTLRRRSLLLQLKMVDKHSFSEVQNELYAKWPPFEFRYEGRTAAHKVLGKEHRGAQFAFIDKHSGDIALDQRPRKPPMPAKDWDQLLASELLLMLTQPNAGGREFYAHPSIDTSGWSSVIWDLLQTTFSASTYRKESRVLNAGAVQLMFDTMSGPQLFAGVVWEPEVQELWAMGHGPDSPPERPPSDDVRLDEAVGAISTVIFEIDWGLA